MEVSESQMIEHVKMNVHTKYTFQNKLVAHVFCINTVNWFRSTMTSLGAYIILYTILINVIINLLKVPVYFMFRYIHLLINMIHSCKLLQNRV